VRHAGQALPQPQICHAWQGVDDIEVTKHGAEHRVHHAEVWPGKVRPRPAALPQRVLDLHKAAAQIVRAGLQRGLVGRRVERADAAQHRRAKLHPRAVAGSLQGVLRVQRRCGDFVQVFADHGRLEQALAAHLQHRRLAQRRQGQKPIGLVRQINGAALKRKAFFVQHDGHALHIGAQRV